MSHNTNKITNNLTVKSVSRAHNVPEDTILQQLLKGIDIELESTSNQDLAYSIALDNLFKVKDYYDKLERLRENTKLINMSTIKGTSFILESLDGTIKQEVTLSQIQKLLEAETISNQDFMEDILSYIDVFQNAEDVNDRRHIVESILTSENIPFTNVKDSYSNNVVVKLYDDKDVIPQYAIVSHFDKVSKSKGINDNAVSVVVLIKVAKEFKDQNIPVDIVFTDKEETGMAGSSLYGGQNRHLKHALVVDVIGFGDVPVVCTNNGKCEFLSSIDITDNLPSDNYSFSRKGIDTSLIVSVPRKDLIINPDGTIKLNKSPEFYQSFHGNKYDDIQYINWSTVKKVYNDIVHYIETRDYTPLTPEEIADKTKPLPTYDYSPYFPRGRKGSKNKIDYEDLKYLDYEDYDPKDDPEWGNLDDDVWKGDYEDYDYEEYGVDKSQQFYSLEVDGDYNFFRFVDYYIEESNNTEATPEELEDIGDKILDIYDEIVFDINLPAEVDFFDYDYSLVFTEKGIDTYLGTISELRNLLKKKGYKANITPVDLPLQCEVVHADDYVAVYKDDYDYIDYPEDEEVPEDEAKKAMKLLGEPKDEVKQESIQESKEMRLLFKQAVGDEYYKHFYSNKVHSRIDNKDIGYWTQHPEELKREVDRLLSLSTRKTKKLKAQEGSELLYEDDNYFVYAIKSLEACQLYGKETMWCITMPNHWNDYTQDNSFIFYIPKKNTLDKYAVLIPHTTNDNIKYFDIYDSSDFLVTGITEAPVADNLPSIPNATGMTYSEYYFNETDDIIDSLYANTYDNRITVDEISTELLTVYGRTFLIEYYDWLFYDVAYALEDAGVEVDYQEETQEALIQPESTLLESREMKERFRQAVGDQYYELFYTPRVYNRIGNKDIGYWTRNPEQLKIAVDSLLDKPTSRELRAKDVEGATLLYEDNNYRVYKIESYPACALYGKGTKWCITQQEYWKYYTDDGSEFYFYVPKDERTHEKYAVRLFDEIEFDIWNEVDKEVSGILDAPVNAMIPQIQDARGMNYFEYYEPWISEDKRDMLVYELDSRYIEDLIDSYKEPWLKGENDFYWYVQDRFRNYTEEDSYDNDSYEDTDDYEEEPRNTTQPEPQEELFTLLQRLFGLGESTSITENDQEDEYEEDDYFDQEPVDHPLSYTKDISGDDMFQLKVSADGYPTYIFSTEAVLGAAITDYIYERYPEADSKKYSEELENILKVVRNYIKVLSQDTRPSIAEELSRANEIIHDFTFSQEVDDDLRSNFKKKWPNNWITRTDRNYNKYLLPIPEYEGLSIPVYSVYFDPDFESNYYLLKKHKLDKQIKALMLYLFGPNGLNLTRVPK